MDGTLHLLKSASGISDVAELHASIKKKHSRGMPIILEVNNRPARSGELQDGGSVYWIIKNYIKCRQPILAIKEVINQADKKTCHIFLKPELFLVVPHKKYSAGRWRYLSEFDMPPDIGPYIP